MVQVDQGWCTTHTCHIPSMIELPSNQYPRLGSKERWCSEWVWFGSLLVGLSLLVIVALRLVMSGDVELNPGPLDSGLFCFVFYHCQGTGGLHVAS